MSFLYSSRTEKGLLFNSPKKHNQDNFIAIPNFTLDSSSHLFSVCDGHGENGHLVSLFIKENFPSKKKYFFLFFLNFYFFLIFFNFLFFFIFFYFFKFFRNFLEKPQSKHRFGVPSSLRISFRARK